MIFVTTGTQFAFDRLIMAVEKACDDGLLDGEVYAQTGQSDYIPRNFPSVQFLDKEGFERCVKDADAVISHAGMGTITAALEHNKPLLVMPRLKIFGEAVNDHQVVIAKKYQQGGHLIAAFDEEELVERIARLRSFVPMPRNAEAAKVAERIRDFMASI